MAGAPPLYGTCRRSTPATVLKSSAARCGGVPLPADEYESLPGVFFASAMNSWSVRAGTSAFTAAMIAPRDTSVMGSNALRGS